MWSALQFALLIMTPAVLSAADQFVGYWKLDPERSIFMGGGTALSGGVMYMATDDGYMFRQATVFGADKVSTRSGRVQFGETAKLNRRASRLTRGIDDNSYEVVYIDNLIKAPVCVFRYTVYPQIKTLIIVVLKGDETVETLVYNKQ